MIRIEKLTKKYGEVTAVDSLSFQVQKGEIVGLVGPNGAGKTTTIRCLVGILPPTSGQIYVSGFDLHQHPVEARRRIAFVPDEPRLFEYMTVWDHIKVISRLYGMEKGLQRGAELLAEFELETKKDAFPVELSRGMKQKLLIILALLHQPEVIVLDEPLTGLDPVAMLQVKKIIRTTTELHTAVLVSSHMLHLIEEICDRIFIIKAGRKIVEGRFSEIRKAIPDLSEDADLEEIFMKALKE